MIFGNLLQLVEIFIGRTTYCPLFKIEMIFLFLSTCIESTLVRLLFNCVFQLCAIDSALSWVTLQQGQIRKRYCH